MDAQEEKRVAKTLTKDHQVVAREELSEEELDNVVGGVKFNCQEFKKPNIPNDPMKGWWFY